MTNKYQTILMIMSLALVLLLAPSLFWRQLLSPEHQGGQGIRGQNIGFFHLGTLTTNLADLSGTRSRGVSPTMHVAIHFIFFEEIFLHIISFQTDFIFTLVAWGDYRRKNKATHPYKTFAEDHLNFVGTYLVLVPTLLGFVPNHLDCVLIHWAAWSLCALTLSLWTTNQIVCAPTLFTYFAWPLSLYKQKDSDPTDPHRRRN